MARYGIAIEAYGIHQHKLCEASFLRFHYDILEATAPPSPGGNELMVDPNEVFPVIGSVAMRREDTPSLARDTGGEEEEMGAGNQPGQVSDERGPNHGG